MTASLVITTRNRVDDLRKALTSAFAQTARPEVVVVDDASTDGSAEMVAREFPDARLIRHAEPAGYIVGRNEAARLVSGDVIVSIDDDADFSSPTTIELTLSEFSSPRVGAIAIPHIDTLSASVVNAPAPDTAIWCIAQYVGTAHAVRRDVFLKMNGYRADMIHQGEEGDFCLRMLAAGYVTRLGRAPFIHHHESPRRSWWRMEYFGRRNDVRQVWHHVPSPSVAARLLLTTAGGIRQAIRTRRPRAHLQGLAAGWLSVVRGTARREPVSPATYQLFRRLKANGPMLLSDFEHELAPLPS